MLAKTLIGALEEVGDEELVVTGRLAPPAMAALIAGALAAGEASASFPLPTRQHELFSWAPAAGLRGVEPMTYMIIGRPTSHGGLDPSVPY